MALENSTFSSRPESLSLPVTEKGEVPAEETKEDAPATGVFNVSEELGHVVTTETSSPPQVSGNNNLSFQDKMAAREAQANQPRKKLQGAGQEWGKFGWGKRFHHLLKILKTGIRTCWILFYIFSSVYKSVHAVAQAKTDTMF